MNYKKGDKVRIKSLDWYNENKNEDGDVELLTHVFLPEMSEYCGTIVTIKDVFGDIDDNVVYQMEGGIVWGWTNEMIECLVERNGKTYPYKIGDRVVLKGNNRCATITDLKYNSWGNLSYYIKIDNDKDISIDHPTDLLLPYDNMIEGLVEDTITTNEELFEPSNVSLEKEMEWNLPKGYQFVDENGNVINATKIVLEKLVVPKFKKGDKIKDKNNRVWYVVHVGNRHFDISSIPNQDSQGYFVPMEDQDDYELCPNKELPKTYEECCTVLRFHYDHYLTYDDEKDINPTKEEEEFIDIMSAFSRLIVCRNAYWKIAGEQMGLGKPWEPDYSGTFEDGTPIKYVIYNIGTHIVKERKSSPNHILSFPTEEMRDAFYENFKKEIEECKELL